MEKSVGVCFIVSGSGQFGLSGGAPRSQLHGGACTLAPVLLTFCEASPRLNLLFLGILSLPVWPDHLGRPSPGVKNPLLDLLFATVFGNEFFLTACIILCSFY